MSHLETTPKTPDGSPPALHGPAKKNRPARILPTDRINFAKQLDILRAYAALSGPQTKTVTNGELSSIVNITSNTVSLSNAFFVDNGFLQRTDKGVYVPSPEVFAFHRAHEWNPAIASHKLAPLLARSWFAEALLPRLSFRPMEDKAAIACLAETAAAGREYEDQLSLLLSYLEAGGLISREGGMVRSAQPVQTPAQPDSVPPEESALPPTLVPAKDPLKPPYVVTSGTPSPIGRSQEGVVQFHVSVRVDMAEFATWKPDRIAAFFSGIAQVLAAKGQSEGGGE